MSTRSLDLKLVLLSMLAHGTCAHETSAGPIPIEWESLLGMVRERLIYREIAGEQIAYLSPTDQLLHLIVHSVCEHGFNNGPLVLTDIAHLLWKTEIDWPAFWRMAAAGNWLRGSWLLLHMTQHYYALQFPSPPTSELPRLPRDLTSLLADLMLSNPNRSADARLHADLYQERRLFRRARVVVQRLCPSSEHCPITHESATQIHGAPAP